MWLQGSLGCSSQRNWPVMRRCTPQWPAGSPCCSSSAIRYLPRRCQWPTRQPWRATQNSSGSGGQATARARSTSIRSMLKSWSCRSRPRRTVSTSGSSGTDGRSSGAQAATTLAAAMLALTEPAGTGISVAGGLQQQKPQPGDRLGLHGIKPVIGRWLRPSRARSRRSCWC